VITQKKPGVTSQAGRRGRLDTGRMTKAPPPRTTTAYFVQAILSFVVSTVSVIVAIAYLPGDAWMRGLLGLGLLYVVTSTFTLAKCVRDHQESASVVNRVDQVRLERLLAEHDPFRTPSNT